MTKNTLVPVKGNKAAILYEQMSNAISRCYNVDDCCGIASEAAAIAAYYKQIKDDSSVLKFMQIKIRAWRRIGEILISANIDKSLCVHTVNGRNSNDGFNMAEYIRRIRTAFKNNPAVEELSDGGIRQAIKLAELPKQFYDQNVGKYASIESLLSAFINLQRQQWEASPEGQAELERQRKRIKEAEIEYNKNVKERTFKEAQQAEQRAKERVDIDELLQAQNEAFEEVGITLDRRDREEMRKIVFLIKKTIHQILRQAAFDNQTTMQSILRSGLMMWFVAHGYSVPTDDMNLPTRSNRNSERKQRG